MGTERLEQPEVEDNDGEASYSRHRREDGQMNSETGTAYTRPAQVKASQNPNTEMETSSLQPQILFTTGGCWGREHWISSVE